MPSLSIYPDKTGDLVLQLKLEGHDVLLIAVDQDGCEEQRFLKFCNNGTLILYELEDEYAEDVGIPLDDNCYQKTERC